MWAIPAFSAPARRLPPHCNQRMLQVVPTAGLPLDDLVAVALLTWFGIQTLRRHAELSPQLGTPAAAAAEGWPPAAPPPAD